MRRNTVIAFVTGFATALGLAAAPAIAASQAVTPGTSTSPQVVIQVPSFQVGATLDAAQNWCGGPVLYNFAIPMRITWAASPGTAPVTAYDLYLDTPPDGPGQSVRGIVLSNTTQTSYAVSGDNYNNECGGQSYPPEYEVVAKTRTGGLDPEFSGTASVYTSRLSASVWQEDGTPEADAGPPLTVTKSGPWSTAKCLCFNGGTTTYTSTAGATITFTVTTAVPGQYVALVMPEASNRGKASLTVDGSAAGTVDTYATTSAPRVVVWQTRLTTAGTHTVKVSDLATSGRPRIDLDSVLMSQAMS